jgi:hypothetical protein
MIEEARLEPVASGLTPVTPGWFVVNAREAAWMNNDQTESCCIFESDDFVLRGRPDLTEYEKPGAGFVLRVLRPGRPTGYYHAESQEDFLVLMGECILTEANVPWRHRWRVERPETWNELPRGSASEPRTTRRDAPVSWRTTTPTL